MNHTMKNLMLTAGALVLSIGAAQAADATDGWYLSLGAGWNHAQDSDFKANGTKDKVDYDEGWLGDVAIGHAWGLNMRTELEGSYRHNNVEKITGTGASGSSGDFHSWNAMVNEYYDFHNNTPWTPYLGAGIGAAFEDARRIGSAFAANDSINGTDTQFAYQGIAGVDYWITPRSAWGLRYDYFGTTRGKFDTSSPAISKASGEYQNQALLVTYRWNFGNEPTPVAETRGAPVAAPMQTSAPVAAPQGAYAVPSEQAIEDSPYKIFFANNSSELNDQGQKVVMDAVAASQNANSIVLHVTSNTDTMGSKGLNDRLSAARAATVRRALIAQGVSPDKINLVSNAERNLPVPTGNHVREPRNRVVTIVLQ